MDFKIEYVTGNATITVVVSAKNEQEAREYLAEDCSDLCMADILQFGEMEDVTDVMGI